MAELIIRGSAGQMEGGSVTESMGIVVSAKRSGAVQFFLFIH